MLDETMMTIHFNADLRPVVGDRVGMLHWVMDPAVSGFIIAYDLGGNQVLICNFDVSSSPLRRSRSKQSLTFLEPDVHPLDSWDEGLCREILCTAIGKRIPFDVLSFRPWILSRKTACLYRKGRVFL
jgi:hypothetical protein